MADLPIQQCTMRRILILLLAIIPLIASAQDIQKDEKKARKDSIRAARREEQRIADSVYRAEIEQDRIRRERERALNGSTAIICETIFDTQQEVFDLLMHNMTRTGLIPADINDKYFIVRTQPKMVGSATYDLTFSVYQEHGKTYLRASGNAYKDFSVGSGLIRSSTSMVVPIEYGGTKDSLFGIAWQEMEKYLQSIPHTNIVYVK